MIRIRIVPPHSVHRRGKPTQERPWMIIFLAPVLPDDRVGTERLRRRWVMIGFVSGLTLRWAIRRFRFAISLRRRAIESATYTHTVKL